MRFPVLGQSLFKSTVAIAILLFICATTQTTNDVRLAGALVPNFAESVAVEARTSNGQTLNLPVEFAGAQTGAIGLDQVNVRLIPELRAAGTVELTLIIAGQRSNLATIFIR